MKRIISFIGVTLLTAMPLFANIAEGVSGDCKWVIDDDGNLDISSETEDAVLGTWEGNAAPWSNFKESITTVGFSTYVKAQTCTHMFSGCTKLNAVYLDNFYTEDVTDMSYMFADCTSLEIVEFGMSRNEDDNVWYAKGWTPYRDNFMTSGVTNMAGMFENCKSLKAFHLPFLDVHNVKDFSDMFAGCTSLKYMDLTTLTVNKSAKVSDMFADCNNLMTIVNESPFPTAEGWKYLFIAKGDNDSKLLGQQTTGIGNIAAVDEDSKTVFSFAGERLSAPVKGLNIIDGKKVMVK